MRVALLLSGLPRKVKEGYNQYWKHVIENYDVDVYLHFWKDSEYEEVLNVYNPKKYICESPVNFTEAIKGIKSINDSDVRPDSQFGVSGPFYSFPMIWGWQQVYNLVDVEYDCIIKSRYDIGTNIPLDLSLFDLTKLNISNSHWPNSPITDDNLLITNQQLASKLYTNIYDDFHKLVTERGCIEFAEKNLLSILEYKELQKYIFKSNNLPFKLLRKF